MQLAVRTATHEALALIERTMQAAGRIGDEYPLVFGPAAGGRLVTLEEEGGEVLAACAILVRELVTPHGIVRAGLIGSVSTDTRVRQQGLATQVLERAEAELESKGCLFALLWAEQPDFYHKRGWREAGSEVDWLLPHAARTALPYSAAVRAARAEDHEQLHALYETQRRRVLRTLEESRALYQVPEMELLVLERDGGAVAYAAQGRGRDLQGVVHEWAGEPDDVLALLRAHLDRLGNDLVLLAPYGEQRLSPRLTALGLSSAVGILGMAKVLRTDRLAALLSRYLGEAGRVREALGGLLVEGPEATLHLRGREVLELLLGLRGERSCALAIEEALGATLEHLPLHPFLWGLDSI